VKRTFDFVVAALGLALLLPVLAAIACAIKTTSSGPIFYCGVRVGRYGRPFRILKFRTMTADADRIGGSSTPTDDPRITRVGAVLRRFKLDELPQLWNVLRGEMSLVGPRPQVPWAVELYSEEERLLLTVRPGITDPASLLFANEAEILRGSSNPDQTYLEKIHPEKMRLSIDYVKNRSFLGDMRILLATLGVVLGRGAACPAVPCAATNRDTSTP